MVKMRKEVRDVAKFDLSNPAHLRSLHSVSFVSEHLLRVKPDLSTCVAFIACLSLKLKNYQQLKLKPMKRSAYCRIIDSLVGKGESLNDSSLEPSAKGFLMKAGEARSGGRPVGPSEVPVR
ncbi:hypothetical protein HK097_000243 [Rhizophlyctis rosea]|uniref:Uncharacterized protein n=1 Tax=Rhizophlyctis rosea TaxID=64517 RepID=A0AAD5S5U9_9FUNG|nr:hypothetical protein HK097_000243 [Rhizophlyctis rosea]